MLDGVDVDRIITERLTRQPMPLQHARLIQKVLEEAVAEMKDMIREKRDLQYAKTWSEKKTKDVATLLETEHMEPATPAYTTMKQLSDAATHFSADYRAHNDVQT